MGYINTGTKRSLTFQVSKEVNGVPVNGYPITYDGKLAGTYNGHVYTFLSSSAFAIMSDADYTTRLNDFKIYVATLEPGIDFITDIVAGFEPTKTDLEDCPPPVDVTTTTTTEGIITTTTTLARRIINIEISYTGTSGETNGISGEVGVCGTNFNLPVYTVAPTNISTTGLSSQTCLVDLVNLIMWKNAVHEAAYIYYRNVGDTEWNDISAGMNFVIPINGNTTVDIEIVVSDVAMTLSCNYFRLTKTDWTDNNRALFDVINCAGDASTLELPDNEEMLVCLHAAVPVNQEDTAVIIGNCINGDSCHSILMTKVADDSEPGTFNAVNCDGEELVLTVYYGDPLTLCLNSATPVNPNDTADILGACVVTTTTTTVHLCIDISIDFICSQPGTDNWVSADINLLDGAADVEYTITVVPYVQFNDYAMEDPDPIIVTIPIGESSGSNSRIANRNSNEESCTGGGPLMPLRQARATWITISPSGSKYSDADICPAITTTTTTELPN